MQKVLKEWNHEEHKEELFFPFVTFVFFVVQGFYAFCDTLFRGDDGCMGSLGGCPGIAGLFDEEAGISRAIYRNRMTAWMQELAGAVGA